MELLRYRSVVVLIKLVSLEMILVNGLITKMIFAGLWVTTFGISSLLARALMI